MSTGDHAPPAGHPSFARGMGSPLGPFTEEVKTHLDESTVEAWRKMCHARDVTSSELLRDVIYLLTHGRTPAEMSADDRRDLLARTGLNQARVGGGHGHAR